MTATETAGKDSDPVLGEARTLAGDYGFGEARSLRLLPEGYANTNYALETSSGTFLYRICRPNSGIHLIFRVTPAMRSRSSSMEMNHSSTSRYTSSESQRQQTG